MAFGDKTTVFPVRGQAFDFTAVILSSATGNPITGGLGTLAVSISKDGGTFAAAAGTVTEIATSSGHIKVSLTAADMEAAVVAYNITSSASNAMYACGEIRTIDSEEQAGRADSADLVKLEQFLLQTWSMLFNRHSVNRGTGVYSVYQSDDATVAVAGAASDDGTVGSRGKLS